MSIFHRNITFGKILEIGEEDVLMLVGGEELVIALPNEAKEQVFKNAEEQIYIAPVDIQSKRIVLEQKTDAIQEYN